MMNWRKIYLFIIIFICFLVSGFLIANIQSRIGEQVMAAHGLSNDSRVFISHKKEKIGHFLSWLQKRETHQHVQLHLSSLKNKREVLIWANYNISALPLDDGHYFSKDDFNGQTSFAVIPSHMTQDVITRQNNQYLKYRHYFISVIGSLKTNSSNFYITTGPLQLNAHDNLKHYEITCDSKDTSLQHKIAAHLHTQEQLPDFVRQHKQYQLTSVLPISLFVIILLSLAVIISGFIASVIAKEAKLTALHGTLLINWLINRSLRTVLIEALIFLASVLLVIGQTSAADKCLIWWLLGLAYLFSVISYIITLIRKKDTNHAAKSRI